MSDRRGKYKEGTKSSLGAIRQRAKDAGAGLRKDHRDKLLARKRLRANLPSAVEMPALDSVAALEAAIEKVPELLRDVSYKGSTKALTSLKELRGLLAEHHEIIDAVLEVPGAVDTLCGLITSHDSQIQLEAIWCIVNIAAGDPKHTQAVLATAPLLIACLAGSSPQHQDLAAWALGNMAADGPETRDILKAQGAVPPLAALLKSKSTPRQVLESVAFALSNLARGQRANAKEMLDDASVLQILAHLRESVQDAEGQTLVSELCWLLTFLTANNPRICALLVQQGALTVLLDVLTAGSGYSSPTQTLTPALRILGNILNGDDSYTTMALQDPRLLPLLISGVSSPYRHVRLESLWVLSTISAGGPEHAMALVQADIPPYVIAIMDEGQDMAEQALYVMCNLADHGEAFVEYLLSHSLMPKLLRLLRAGQPDTCRLCLQCIEICLREYPPTSEIMQEEEGVEALEAFEYHQNSELSSMAVSLIEKYFYTEEGY